MWAIFSKISGTSCCGMLKKKGNKKKPKLNPSLSVDSFFYSELQKTSREADSITTLHSWQESCRDKLRNSNLLSHTWSYFQLSWNEQVLNLTGKDNFKSEPGAKDVGRYLSAGKKKTIKGPRSYPWYSRCKHKFAIKHLGQS